MRIHGFQKLTLLDYPGKTACTVFTGGCNMRCPFCHNADLVLNPNSFPMIPEEEIFSYLEKRKTTLEGVCITGGEPMLMKDLPSFAEKIKSLGFAVKIDTNGSFPSQLKYIVRSGLADYIAMDIKNSFAKYPMTVGRNDFDVSAVIESIEFLKSAPIDHEFRTTVCKNLHEPSDIIDIARFLGKDQKYFLQSFKDSGKVLSGGNLPYAPSEMNDILNSIKEYSPLAKTRGI